MNNDPELNPKYLGKISSDFVKLADQIKEASYLLRKRDISQFPIFPVSQTEIPIGALLYEKHVQENEWHYYISFMEEFVERGLVKETEGFQSVYKDPDEFCCLFIVEPDFTNFLFIPYPED